MELLDGKKVKNEILEDLKIKISKLDLSLAVIQIGSDEASNVYINEKEKMCDYLNISFKYYQFDSNINEEDILALIDKLNSDQTTGILLQLPIPKKFNLEKLQNAIDYKKDVDGFNDKNVANLYNNRPYLVPCTAKGIITLLEYYKIDMKSKNIVIVGRSNLIGKPLFHLLLNKDATITLCHSKTPNLSYYTKKADILITGVGKKDLITKGMVKKDAIIVDAGIERADGKLYGDVSFADVKDKVSYITPVPGGIGPMTIATLATNICEAYLLQSK